MNRNKTAGIEFILKLIYSEKATKFFEILTLLLLCYLMPVKSKVKVLQNFVAFSVYMNFNIYCLEYCKNTMRLISKSFKAFPHY